MRVTIVDPEADAAANPAPPAPVDEGLSVVAPVTIVAAAQGAQAPFILQQYALVCSGLHVFEGEGAFLKPITGGSIGLRRNALGDLFVRVQPTTLRDGQHICARALSLSRRAICPSPQ